MIKFVVIVAVIFGVYKLIQWARENTNLNLSDKNVFIIVGVAFLALIKWAYSRESKPTKLAQSWQRTYQCTKCNRTTTTIFNPAETEKTTCYAGGSHRWQRIE
ncbi:hypothetical protein [Enterococcus rivorum]|uniref:Uncharacterized protein n=1 Tax=Enterococcus rivorum TaxID=762845 RepID=A0A1E5KUC8_9ENTE|nr:hypothetical protein [Enterococcus rivorum]MBP2098928.1 hypothetical protein [Enterococcus rivorum]OEH81473.1 hypothetical protein BCR26_04300 [Enterococcus rivorum]